MHSREVYAQVAWLHAHNIDQGFLSSLGEAFLALLYEAIDADDNSILLVEQFEGRIVGFVAGAQGMGSIYRQLLTRTPRLIGALLPALISPKKMWKIAEIIFLSKKTPLIPNLPRAELLSIVVDPVYRAQGHALSLYTRLVRHFQSQNIDGFKIVVGESLSGAHRFYLKAGAKAVGNIEIHHGQSSVMYIHNCS